MVLVEIPQVFGQGLPLTARKVKLFRRGTSYRLPGRHLARH
jgi:hypothetical protein